jgi:SEC-C motif-containing protein
MCYCGLDLEYSECCGQYHDGEKAPTAEALMRSRFTAYALGLFDYIQDTMEGAPAADFDRNSAEEQHEDLQWTRLDVLKVDKGSETDEAGIVEFVAHYVMDGQASAFREESQFLKKAGRWYYVAGKHKPI